MASSSAPEVALVGMAALRRDLRRMSDDQSSPLYAAIKAAGKQAAEPVAGRTRSSLPVDDRDSSWNHPGRLSGTVRTSGTRTGAAVRMGLARVPYAGWIEFGGRRPDGSSREFVRDGRYLFPAARGLANVAAVTYATALDEVFGSAGVWTNVTTDPEAVHD